MASIDLKAMSVDNLDGLIKEASALLEKKRAEAAMAVRINQSIRFADKDGEKEGTVVLIDTEGVQCTVKGAKRNRRLKWSEIILV